MDSTRENRRVCGAYLTLHCCESKRCWTCVLYLSIFILAPLSFPKVCPCHFFAPCMAASRMFQEFLGAKLCATETYFLTEPVIIERRYLNIDRRCIHRTER